MKSNKTMRTPKWAAKYIGQNINLGAIQDLIDSGQIQMDEISPNRKYDITFMTLLNCPCQMQESKACISIQLKAGVLTALSTEFLAYVFNPPMVGWKQTGQPCMGKDDETAQCLIEQMTKDVAKTKPKKAKALGKRQPAHKKSPAASKR